MRYSTWSRKSSVNGQCLLQLPVTSGGTRVCRVGHKHLLYPGSLENRCWGRDYMQMCLCCTGDDSYIRTGFLLYRRVLGPFIEQARSQRELISLEATLNQWEMFCEYTSQLSLSSWENSEVPDGVSQRGHRRTVSWLLTRSLTHECKLDLLLSLSCLSFPLLHHALPSWNYYIPNKMLIHKSLPRCLRVRDRWYQKCSWKGRSRRCEILGLDQLSDSN